MQGLISKFSHRLNDKSDLGLSVVTRYYKNMTITGLLKVKVHEYKSVRPGG